MYTYTHHYAITFGERERAFQTYHSLSLLTLFLLDIRLLVFFAPRPVSTFSGSPRQFTPDKQPPISNKWCNSENKTWKGTRILSPLCSGIEVQFFNHKYYLREAYKHVRQKCSPKRKNVEKITKLPNLQQQQLQTNKLCGFSSQSELYRPSDRRLSAKLVPTLVDTNSYRLTKYIRVYRYMRKWDLTLFARSHTQICICRNWNGVTKKDIKIFISSYNS
jgi:hypothetical protein